MEREADLSRGMALGCFYSNLCKWACLHCARFLCEPGSQTYQSIEPGGGPEVYSAFLALGTDRGV